MNNKTNELILSKFMEFCYKSDENKPAKTIFFCSSKFHANRLKRCFDKMYPKYSGEAQVITYETYKAQDEIRRFKNESNLRIIFSVNMLDTGVNIPEVCNLVIIKQIFSHIQFWQMICRGTRNFESCKHPEWLLIEKRIIF
jgi:type I restriction enzyme R subunit